MIVSRRSENDGFLCSDSHIIGTSRPSSFTEISVNVLRDVLFFPIIFLIVFQDLLRSLVFSSNSSSKYFLSVDRNKDVNLF